MITRFDKKWIICKTRSSMKCISHWLWLPWLEKNLRSILPLVFKSEYRYIFTLILNVKLRYRNIQVIHNGNFTALNSTVVSRLNFSVPYYWKRSAKYLHTHPNSMKYGYVFQEMLWGVVLPHPDDLFFYWWTEPYRCGRKIIVSISMNFV